MARTYYRRFYSLFEWFWCRILLWRYLAPVFYSVVGYARRVITWRESSRCRQDESPERPGERDCEAAAGGGELGPEGGEPSQLSMCGEYEELMITNNTTKYIYSSEMYARCRNTRLQRNDLSVYHNFLHRLWCNRGLNNAKSS